MPKFSKYIYYEIAAWLLGILGLIVLLWEPLSGQGILKHDNIKWNFPVFKFFIETLNGGELPLWNPFSNAGLPFFPVASQMRLWEPLHILFAFVGPLFTKDIVSLYVANRVLHSLVMVLGIYLLLRSYTKYLIVRLSLIPILLYSSIFLGSFRQDGIINQFLWAGYSTYFLLQLLKTEKWKPHHVFGFILCFGLSFQSYFFTGTTTFFLFILTYFACLYSRRTWKNIISNLKWMALILCLLSGMMLPNIVLQLQSKEWAFPIRMLGNIQNIDKSINMDYSSMIRGGTRSTVKDYFVMWNLYDNSRIFSFKKTYQPEAMDTSEFLERVPSSEAYIYLGVLACLLIVIGFVFGRQRDLNLWRFILLSMIVISLGPEGVYHRVLFYFVPIFWFFRHTHLLVIFVETAFLYFYCVGFNQVIGYFKANKSKISSLVRLTKWEAFYAVIMLVLFAQAFFIHASISTGTLLIIFLTVFGNLIFWRKSWSKRIFASLLFLWIGLYLVTSNDLVPSVKALLILIPVVLFAVFIWFVKDKLSPNNLSKLSAIFLLLFSLGDLVSSFIGTKRLYNNEPSIFVNNANRMLTTSRNFETRLPFLYSENTESLQGSKYPELIHRRFVATTPPYGVVRPLDKWTPEYVFQSDRRRRYTLMQLRTTMMAEWTEQAEQLYRTFLIGKKPMQLFADNSFSEPLAEEPLVDIKTWQHLEVQTNANLPTWLYWANGNAAYWKAYLDGQPASIVPANRAFMSVAVPSGLHQIVFRYENIPFRVAIYMFLSIAVLSFFAMVGTFYFTSRRLSCRIGPNR